MLQCPLVRVFTLQLCFGVAAAGCSQGSPSAHTSDASALDASATPSDSGPVVVKSDGWVASNVDGAAANGAAVDAGAADSEVPADAAASGDAGSGPSAGPDLVPMVAPGMPAVARGSTYRGFAERFNRYYSDTRWQPANTVYVSPAGGGDGSSRERPKDAASAIGDAAPGTRIYFLPGTYAGCFELGKDRSGSYDAPIVLYAERASDGTRKVKIDCCATGRQTCINLEAADYVAVDGFELSGGKYGVRAVGADFAANQHQRGVAVLDCEAHGQSSDPFFTGQSDWYVIERSQGHDAGSGDGHGIYLSNGSDWNIVRANELWNNHSADFQINADPASSCTGAGIELGSPDCDALAGTPGDGGRGVSDFMLVESNFFHDGLAQGANFTSVRHSIVRNNIFAVYARHGVSFWQETDNPRLGSSDNEVLHNLFVANVANRQMIQFVVHSDRNAVTNNVFVGVGNNMLAMEVDDTVRENRYRTNHYIHARVDGRVLDGTERVSDTLDTGWFQAFPAGANRDTQAFRPSGRAPFLDQGAPLPNAHLDRTGRVRTAPTDLGPFEQ